MGNAPPAWVDPFGEGRWRPVPENSGWEYRHDNSAGGRDPSHTQYRYRGQTCQRRVYPDGSQRRHGGDVDMDVPERVVKKSPPHRDAPKPGPSPSPSPSPGGGGGVVIPIIPAGKAAADSAKAAGFPIIIIDICSIAPYLVPWCRPYPTPCPDDDCLGGPCRSAGTPPACCR